MRPASSSGSFALKLALIVLLTGAMSPDLAALAQVAPRSFPCDEAGSARTGDIVTDAASVRVVVPPPGFAVRAHALLVDGSESLAVRTEPDGQVVASHCGSERTEASGTATSVQSGPSACSDDDNVLDGHEWRYSFRWRFNINTTPGELNPTNTESALKRGVTNITTMNDDCGHADTMPATHIYEGTTSVGVNVRSDAACLTRDGLSVVAFGNLPQQYVAYTCVYSDFIFSFPWTGERALESDVKYNKGDYNFIINIPADDTVCQQQSKYWVEGAQTHESGHTFGLDDLPEAGNENLTMSDTFFPCDTRDATLGLGDMLGLEEIYADWPH